MKDEKLNLIVDTMAKAKLANNSLRKYKVDHITQEHLWAIAASRIVHISFLESCMATINQLSNNRRLPQKVSLSLIHISEPTRPY